MTENEKKFKELIKNEDVLNWFLGDYLVKEDWTEPVDEEYCDQCEMLFGCHEKGCPNNIDPRQNLLTDGFD